MVLISEIEEEFSVSLTTDDIIAMDSFGQALNIVSKYL
jgi:acyl carrier protein